MSAYALDTNMAREGSGSAGGRIDETGAYIGKIEWAREMTNQNGTSLIEIRFIEDSGQYANLTVYTANNKGEHLRGMKQIHALMAVAKIRSMNAVQGVVEAYDFDENKVTPQQSMVLPELAGKRVGLFLQKEFYSSENGQKSQMNLFAPFTADTRQVAQEVLDNKGEAVALDRMIDSIKDRYRDNVQQMQAAPAYAPSPAPNTDDFDDDIPF